MRRSDSLNPYGMLKPCGLEMSDEDDALIQWESLTQTFFFLAQVHGRNKDRTKVVPKRHLFLHRSY